ncbi:MAG: KdsC family phosphatase [Candidatus Anammoxibacter sp.]
MNKLAKIKMVITDVDGVLTDSSITLDSEGNESKTFNARDGAGIKFLQRTGVKFAIISGRHSSAVDLRAKELGIKDVYQGAKKKIEAYEKIISEHGLKDEEVCFIGDDLVDIPVLLKVGFAVGVADAVTEVIEIVDFVTVTPGGRGAVREVAERVIKGQGKWGEITTGYFKN